MLPKWNLADIRSRMFNRPLLVTRDRALDALGVMGPKLSVGALFFGNGDPAQSLDQMRAHAAATRMAMDELPGDEGLKKYMYLGEGMYCETDPYELWNGVAVLSVRGALMAEHGIDPVSGATGYDGLSFKARHAAQNPAVKGAILDIDSGGGEVIDLMELCAQLRGFAADKPLRAILRGSACSAAYALAACAGPGNVTAAPYSIVGSIGAIMLHADFSKQLEQEGIDVTMITSADHKADASQMKPLDADVRTKLKGMVDACASTFIDHVAEAREMDRSAIVAQQAGFFSGQEALSLGLVDKFMSWDDSMREFAGIVNGPGARPASGHRSTGGPSMSSEATAPAAGSQPETITAEAHASALAEARAEGVTAGATAERERISALAELDAGTTLSAALGEAIAAGTSAGDFAVGLARANKARQGAALGDLQADAVASANLPGTDAAAAAGGQQAPVNRGAAAVARLRGKVKGLPATS